jgi:hypothetical protein
MVDVAAAFREVVLNRLDADLDTKGARSALDSVKSGEGGMIKCDGLLKCVMKKIDRVSTITFFNTREAAETRNGNCRCHYSPTQSNRPMSMRAEGQVSL